MISDQLLIFLLLVVMFNVDASPRPQSDGGNKPLLEVPQNHSNLNSPKPRNESGSRGNERRKAQGSKILEQVAKQLQKFSSPRNDREFDDDGERALKVPRKYSNLQVPKGRARPQAEANGTNQETPIIPTAISSVSIPDTEGQSSSNITSKALGQLPKPFASTDALAVDVAVQIQSIREINENEQRIIIEIELTVHWKDYNFLKENKSYVPPDVGLEDVSWLLQTFESKALPFNEFDRLWKPDIFIERVVRVTRPELLASPVTVRTIKTTSSIVYTMRASVQVDCNMNFQYYPADTQHCILDIRSYQNDQTVLSLQWNPAPGAYLVDTDSDDNFDVKLSYVAQREKKVKNINLEDAIFDVLQFKLSMRRRMTYHLLQTYVPSAFLVFITWLTFLIPEGLIEARIGISMTTLLTLTAMFSAVRENTPVVSYVRAIDIWMVYCIFIVFATLLEFTFFIWLRNYKIAKRQQKWKKLVCQLSLKKMEANPIEPKHSEHSNLEDLTSTATKAFEHTAKILNQFAFGFFVLNFVIFSSIYWPWLLIWSEHYQWTIDHTLNGNATETDSKFIDKL